MNFKERFAALLQDAIDETGIDLIGGVEVVAEYAAERVLHLATIPVADPGFLEAVRAERDNVALRAGLVVTYAADVTDARVVGIIGGALAIASEVI